MRCTHCQVKPATAQCSQCNQAVYCSASCQATHWTTIHQAECIGGNWYETAGVNYPADILEQIMLEAPFLKLVRLWDTPSRYDVRDIMSDPSRNFVQKYIERHGSQAIVDEILAAKEEELQTLFEFNYMVKFNQEFDKAFSQSLEKQPDARFANYFVEIYGNVPFGIVDIQKLSPENMARVFALHRDLVEDVFEKNSFGDDYAIRFMKAYGNILLPLVKTHAIIEFVLDYFPESVWKLYAKFLLQRAGQIDLYDRIVSKLHFLESIPDLVALNEGGKRVTANRVYQEFKRAKELLPVTMMIQFKKYFRELNDEEYYDILFDVSSKENSKSEKEEILKFLKGIKRG